MTHHRCCDCGSDGFPNPGCFCRALDWDALRAVLEATIGDTYDSFPTGSLDLGRSLTVVGNWRYEDRNEGWASRRFRDTCDDFWSWRRSEDWALDQESGSFRVQLERRVWDTSDGAIPDSDIIVLGEVGTVREYLVVTLVEGTEVWSRATGSRLIFANADPDDGNILDEESSGGKLEADLGAGVIAARITDNPVGVSGTCREAWVRLMTGGIGYPTFTLASGTNNPGFTAKGEHDKALFAPPAAVPVSIDETRSGGYDCGGWWVDRFSRESTGNVWTTNLDAGGLSIDAGMRYGETRVEAYDSNVPACTTGGDNAGCGQTLSQRGRRRIQRRIYSSVVVSVGTPCAGTVQPPAPLLFREVRRCDNGELVGYWPREWFETGVGAWRVRGAGDDLGECHRPGADVELVAGEPIMWAPTGNVEFADCQACLDSLKHWRAVECGGTGVAWVVPQLGRDLLGDTPDAGATVVIRVGSGAGSVCWEMTTVRGEPGTGETVIGYGEAGEILPDCSPCVDEPVKLTKCGTGEEKIVNLSDVSGYAVGTVLIDSSGDGWVLTDQTGVDPVAFTVEQTRDDCGRFGEMVYRLETCERSLNSVYDIPGAFAADQAAIDGLGGGFDPADDIVLIVGKFECTATNVPQVITICAKVVGAAFADDGLLPRLGIGQYAGALPGLATDGWSCLDIRCIPQDLCGTSDPQPPDIEPPGFQSVVLPGGGSERQARTVEVAAKVRSTGVQRRAKTRPALARTVSLEQLAERRDECFGDGVDGGCEFVERDEAGRAYCGRCGCGRAVTLDLRIQQPGWACPVGRYGQATIDGA